MAISGVRRMVACVIGCFFGNNYETVYPAVKNYDAYFFSNNSKIKSDIEAAGWRYIFINFPLSDDLAISSLQSKYIKFLQFLKSDDFSFFTNYDIIIYTDHKLELKDTHIKYLIGKFSDYKIVVRNHPGERKNIWEEVGVSMFQERYLRFMPQTIDYIREKIQNGYSEYPIVVWTSLIAYKHSDNKTINFVDMVYNDLIKIGTSQCQIIWSLLGQKYKEIIKIIKWDELDIKWKEPQKLIKRIIKLFIPFGVLELRKIIKTTQAHTGSRRSGKSNIQ